MQTKKSQPRLIIGLILILIGSLILLNNKGIINYQIPDFIFSWQAIIIFVGLILFLSTGSKTAGGILIFIGAISLFPEFWPLILIGIGIYVLLKHSSAGKKIIKPNEEEFGESDFINVVNIFSGTRKTVHSDNFKGGKIISIFGGSEIDLTECRLAAGEQELKILSIFGGSVIRIPDDWKVELKVTPILGGFADSRIPDANRVFDESKILKITGESIFGGGEIKN